MAGGSAIRGSRVGAGPMGEAERGEAIERFVVSYWCANGHEVRPSFAQEEGVEIPDTRSVRCNLATGYFLALRALNSPNACAITKVSKENSRPAIGKS